MMLKMCGSDHGVTRRPVGATDYSYPPRGVVPIARPQHEGAR